MISSGILHKWVQGFALIFLTFTSGNLVIGLFYESELSVVIGYNMSLDLLALTNDCALLLYFLMYIPYFVLYLFAFKNRSKLLTENITIRVACVSTRCSGSWARSSSYFSGRPGSRRLQDVASANGSR